MAILRVIFTLVCLVQSSRAVSHSLSRFRLYSSSSGTPAGSPVSKFLDLEIQYCGGCGFDKYYNDLKEAIELNFPGRVRITPIRDADLTGNFEITLPATKQLVHSKTKKGMGKCESKEERDKLFAIIKLYLDFLEKKQ